jgi:hypothetical protein
MSLSSPSTFLCVAGNCTVVDKNAHTICARHGVLKNYEFYVDFKFVEIDSKMVLEEFFVGTFFVDLNQQTLN